MSKKYVSFAGLFVLMVSFFMFAGRSAYASENTVNPLQTYTYQKMERDIKLLAKKYPGLIHYEIIGKSEYGRSLYAVSLGTGKADVLINGAHHAREWLTANLNMFMLDQYAQAYKANKTLNGYRVKDILSKTTIWFVPMVNPDGVTLEQSGLSAFPKKVWPDLIKMNGGSKNFKRWKANGMGVDLNRQYDADWKHILYNPGHPFWKDYKGKAPVTASETKAMVRFTERNNPEMEVSYHTAGKVLYWNFHQDSSQYKRDLAYAKTLGKMTHYSLVYPKQPQSGGGLTDWFISHFKRPGFTLEIGSYQGESYLPMSEFYQAWNENKLVGLYVAKQGYSLYQVRHK
jgi:murein tripeptide amidase MpaA